MPSRGSSRCSRSRPMRAPSSTETPAGCSGNASWGGNTSPGSASPRAIARGPSTPMARPSGRPPWNASTLTRTLPAAFPPTPAVSSNAARSSSTHPAAGFRPSCSSSWRARTPAPGIPPHHDG